MAELARLYGRKFPSFEWLATKLENSTLRRTTGVFCNSEYTEGLVKPRAHRTWRVPNPVREPFFAPGVPTGPAKCRLLNVGLVTPRKRQLDLLTVAEQLHRDGLEFELHFIGEAPPSTSYATQFLQRIKPMEAKGFVRYVGTKTVDELVKYFDASSALLHFPAEEAFGLVVAEALARNLKFFGAKLGGIKDIAAYAPGAELFDTEDWSALRQSISRWIKTGAPRPTGAAELMRSRYHPDLIARRHLEIYREVLSNPS
jgi:glycosyltransferase involved in cell wall biosynthesis